MSFIHINPPPAVRQYEHRIDTKSITDVTNDAVDYMKGQIGRNITLEYENGSKRTPFQNNRIIAITVLAISIIAAVGFVVGAVFIAPLVIPAVFFACLAIGTTVYLCTQGRDLDSPIERQQVRNEIAQSTFQTINRTYNIEKMIGYGLLDQAAIGLADETKRARFYARFKNLQAVNSQLENWRTTQISAVESNWGNETLPIRDWHAREQQLIDQQLRLMDYQEAAMRNKTRRIEHHTHKPAVGMRVATATVLAINTMTEIQLRQHARDNYGILQSKIYPWNMWREQSLASIESVYRNAQAAIEAQYTQMKSNAA